MISSIMRSKCPRYFLSPRRLAMISMMTGAAPDFQTRQT
jgi:hypothetical protein